MPTEESKPVEPKVDEIDAALKGKQAEVDSGSEDDEPATNEAGGETGAGTGEGSKKKKKKSKRAKVKEALTGSSGDPEADIKKAIGGLTPQQLQELMALNPALAQEITKGNDGKQPTPDQAAELMKRLNLQDIMTGLAAGGKNVKDMGDYKFWKTQPVADFKDPYDVEDGPLKPDQKVEDVPKERAPLVAGFEWCEVDLLDEGEMKEVYELLNGHYVEDDEAMFRFNYSPSILRWAMMAPGWKKEYHIGVRATQSRKLVAFISAIPQNVRVRDKVILTSDVNFLCVHKKLRGKRLAPVLIKEITRVSNLNEIWQGLHTGGIVLPRPVSTARYFHRALNWQKLYDCGFSPLPPGSKPQYQVRKYALPESTSTKGLREMKEADLDAVMDLMGRYHKKYELAPEFDAEEAKHWFVPEIKPGEDQVVWSYVVEDANKKVTDFFSFYIIESSIINHPKHDVLRVAYLWYYGSETGVAEPHDRAALKTRLNSLVHDALILAKRAKFDVFNALSLMDNALFLEQQKFGGGDGQLHFYLFNYRAKPIAGGVDKKNQLDEKNLSGLGLVML